MPTRTSRSSPCARALLSDTRRSPDDVQAGADRALRVVLVGDRRAEEGEDRVAHQPGERALVAVDRRDQALEGAVHDLGPVLGIHRLGHRGRAFDVAEQHRDGAALALHRAAGAGGLELGQHLLRQEPVEIGGGAGVQLRAARVAEPRALGVLVPTGWAGHGRNDSRGRRERGSDPLSVMSRCWNRVPLCGYRRTRWATGVFAKGATARNRSQFSWARRSSVGPATPFSSTGRSRGTRCRPPPRRRRPNV